MTLIPIRYHESASDGNAPETTPSGELPTRHSRVALHDNWRFKKSGDPDDAFLPVAQFPTNVHLDLLHHNKIPDPFVGTNELAVKWVGEAAWVYTTTFAAPAPLPEGAAAELVFEGLDTFAAVELNGHEILRSDNMFRSHRVDVAGVLETAEGPGGAADNVLTITFESAARRGRRIMDEHKGHRWGCSNGTPDRLAVRKAQYHWGWDWGPDLQTCGPWRPVALETYQVRIAGLSATATLASPGLASVRIELALDSAAPVTEGSTSSVLLEIFAPSAGGEEEEEEEADSAGNPIAVQRVTVPGRGSSDASFVVADPKLWHPAGSGRQHLYAISASVLGPGGSVPHKVTKRFGIRSIELVQEPLRDAPGTGFCFRVNGSAVFCGGCNWIPADSFLPRISPDRYRAWLGRAASANLNMVRVWGGGTYECDAFYDACDRLGILVWQDFMFACGNYPAFPAFLDSVRAEAEDNVRRLAGHPCIALWAGNNEDYQYAENEGLEWDPANGSPETWLRTEFPARYIYEKLLPEVVARISPGTHYHPGSPWGGSRSSDPTAGDIHQWNVWHGAQERYQDFGRLTGRFVSEFGMEAFPGRATIEAFLPRGRRDAQYGPSSAVVDFHNKATGQDRRLGIYLAENVGFGSGDVARHAYLTQLVQAEALAAAYRACRRQWKGPGREYCSGALVWQLNDCWPGISWSICDYFLRPKGAYFAVKREMGPITVGAKRTQQQQQQQPGGGTAGSSGVSTRYEIWYSNASGAEIRGARVLARRCRVATGKMVSVEAFPVDVAARRSSDLEAEPAMRGDESDIVLHVALWDVGGGKLLAEHLSWPEPLKHVALRPAGLSLSYLGDNTIRVSARAPAKGVTVETDDDRVELDDNMFDLLPHRPRKVKVRGWTSDTRYKLRCYESLNWTGGETA